MQTSDDFAKLIQPLLGRSFWRLYCDLDGIPLAELTHFSSEDQLSFQQCDQSCNYGQLMVELDGGNGEKDLTFTHDFYRDGLAACRT